MFAQPHGGPGHVGGENVANRDRAGDVDQPGDECQPECDRRFDAPLFRPRVIKLRREPGLLSESESWITLAVDSSIASSEVQRFIGC